MQCLQLQTIPRAVFHFYLPSHKNDNTINNENEINKFVWVAQAPESSVGNPAVGASVTLSKSEGTGDAVGDAVGDATSPLTITVMQLYILSFI